MRSDGFYTLLAEFKMRNVGFYLLVAALIVCALWALIVFCRFVFLLLRCRREFLPSDIGREILMKKRRGKKVCLALFSSVLFGALIVGIMLLQQYQAASVNITLTYTEAALGLNPNGSRYNMSDILSNEVLEAAIDDMGIDIDTDTLKEGLEIEPAEKKKDEDDEGMISTQFKLSFKSGRKTGALDAEEVLQHVANAYREWFWEKYTPNFASLDIDFDDLEAYDYPDMQSYLEVAVRRISAFADAFLRKDSAFLSSVTHESFSSLKAKAMDIENTGLETLNSYILYNGLSRDPDKYMSRIRFSHLQTSNEYLKNIRAYNVYLRAIGRYDNDMAVVVYIPTYDVDNTFYMSKTKIGIDHFSINAESYSAAASGNLATIMSQDYLLRQLNAHRGGEAAMQRVDEMIGTLKTEILDLAKKARLTAQDYLETEQYGYISIAFPDHGYLLEYAFAVVAAMVYFIFAYLGLMMSQLDKQARNKMMEVRWDGPVSQTDGDTKGATEADSQAKGATEASAKEEGLQ